MKSIYPDKLSLPLLFARGRLWQAYLLVLGFWGIIPPQAWAQESSRVETNTGKERAMKMQSKITGQGTPIVLVPGGLTGWISWEPHAERLSSTREVIRVQLLNVEYGFNQQPLPEGYSVKTESQALAATLDDLGLKEPLDIVSWSYGADVTLDFALDHPDQVRTLTLIEPPALWLLRANGSYNPSTGTVFDFMNTLHGDITDEMLEQFMQFVGLTTTGKKAQDMPQWPLWRSYKLSLRNSPALVQQPDRREQLRTFQPPVLLVKGTGSAPFLHQIIDSLAVYLPHARVTEMPGGHAPQIVSMDRFLEEVASFQTAR